jgi:group II intron reverse transcriptase/maturase
VVDVDIERFFDSVDHEKMIGILQKRISDPRFLRLIRKLMKAGVMKGGQAVPNSIGTPQGSIVSPILANIYLHDVLDQWFQENYGSHDRKMVRYADDVVFCFKRKEEAEGFYQALKSRLEMNGLKLNEGKSRIVPFQAKGNGVFHFLGMTFYWGKDRKRRALLKLKTQAEKFRRSVQAFTTWIKENRNKTRLKVLWEEAKAKLRGHYAYYGVAMNYQLGKYYFLCEKILFKWVNRRSQKPSLSWERFQRRLRSNPLPKPWGHHLINIAQGELDYAV